jgi:hypothetical protein
LRMQRAEGAAQARRTAARVASVIEGRRQTAALRRTTAPETTDATAGAAAVTAVCGWQPPLRRCR